MKRNLIFSLLFMMLLCSFSATAGKQHCQNYRKKLDNIQIQQRQPNNLKRSNSLAKKEAKARNIWWRCENGKLKTKSKKKPIKKKPATKRVKTKKHKNITNQRAKSKRIKTPKPLVPFASNSPVIGHSVYQGEKLQAWLDFYQPDKTCARPKSTQEFVACAEEKRRQRAEFEKTLVDN